MINELSNVTICEHIGLQMASLAAFRGRAAAMSDATRAAWGLGLPTTPHRVSSGDLAFIWAGPDRWLVTSPLHAEGAGADLATSLRSHLDGLAAITDQGAGRATFRVSGAGARDMLTTVVGVDLHPRAFAPGDTALTVAAHMNVQIWQVDCMPTYDITVFRSFATSLHHALLGVRTMRS